VDKAKKANKNINLNHYKAGDKVFQSCGKKWITIFFIKVIPNSYRLIQKLFHKKHDLSTTV